MSWRNLMKNRRLFIINVTGLALGIATCLIIMLFVTDELSYDRYNEKVDRIMRIVLKGKVNGEIIKEAVTPAPIAATLKSEFPEVVDGTRIRGNGTPKIIVNGNSYRGGRMAFVDPDFFEVFTLPLIQGDPATALKEPNTIVITPQEAARYLVRKIRSTNCWR